MQSRFLVAMILFVPVFLATTPVDADLGNGGQLDTLDRLQGEAYTTPDPGCDPADGQHTKVILHEGQNVVQMPYSSCWVEFPDISFSGDAVLTWFRVARNDEDPLVVELRVLADGTLVGRGTYQGFLSGSEPLVLYSFDETVPLAAGVYDIRVEYEIVRGPLWHNLMLDYLQWDVDDPCQNQPPQPGIVVANGAGSQRRTGWQDHVYIFSLAAYLESEGDPVRFEWLWDDGVVQYGTVVVRAFPEGRLYGATITVTDDPIWRCVNGSPKTTQFPYSFTSVSDAWVVTWDSPQSGFSCAATTFRSSTPFDVVAGQCWMQGSVVTTANVASFDVRGRLRLDGAQFRGFSFGAVARQSFFSVEAETEFHTFDACFGMANDVYERSFCSGEYLFFNVGR